MSLEIYTQQREFIASKLTPQVIVNRRSSCRKQMTPDENLDGNPFANYANEWRMPKMINTWISIKTFFKFLSKLTV